MTASHGWTMVSWPDSQRIMGHPQAYLIAGVVDSENIHYVVPTEVWCHYQHSYYEDEE